MMKIAFALVALLHLCYTFEVNETLNREIIHRLEELNGLYRGKKLNMTATHMRVPVNMSKHASSCVSDVVRELNSVLCNVTVPVEKQHLLREIKENLLVLDPHQQTDPVRCSMRERPIRSSFWPFRQFAEFFRTLNKYF